jgi:hypothetical protein
MVERRENPDVQFETKDLGCGAVITIVVGIGVAIAAASLAAWWVFGMIGIQPQSPAEQSAARAAEEHVPPQPRLEPLEPHGAGPGSDYFARERARESLLHGYGKTGDKGYVHIPIEKAIERFAGQAKVRATPAGNQAKRNGLVADGDSNSGRVLREAQP